MTNLFSLAAFKIISLHLIFGSCIIMYLGEYLIEVNFGGASELKILDV